MKKFGCSSDDHPHVMQIPCILTQANIPLNAPVFSLPSFLIQDSQKLRHVRSRGFRMQSETVFLDFVRPSG